MATEDTRTTATQWAQLEHHFQAALELDPTDRAAYLDAHCADPDLREEIEKLLRADHDSRDAIGAAIGREAETLNTAQIINGTQVGAYRIVEKIAEGGMGAVYRGERADGAFKQTVAIKLLRQALPTNEAVARFRHERQVLADLQHPGIARLLGGGSTDAGLPYLIMEFVDGLRIDHYCRQHALSVPQCLHLFQQVCAAVQAAHQNLIVHRDIKPTNILVDPAGVPKLLDFGIAKLLTPATGSDTPETVLGQQVMTPMYASPEQVRGQAITTATDVYSLGLLLYELLTGRSPYAQWRDQPLEMQRAICETEPPRPSQSLRLPAQSTSGRTVEVSHPEGGLHRDIDAIVLKAMRKAPGERYASPSALAEDIQRHLDGEPVLARQGTLRYRTEKFLRRNAVAVGATASVIAGIVGLTALHTVQITAERDLAQRERATAEQISEFMVRLFDHGNPEKQNPDTKAQDILAQGARRVETELADSQPEIAARLLHTIARGTWALGDYDEAVRQFERSTELFRHAGLKRDTHYADMLRDYTQTLLGIEDWTRSARIGQEAIDVARAVYGPRSPELADALQVRAQARLREHQRDPDIRDDLHLALDILSHQPEPDHHLLSFLYSQISSWHKLNYDYPTALDWAQKAWDAEALVAGPQARGMLWMDEDLARLHWRLGQCSKAITGYLRGLDLLERYKGRDHADTNWSHYFLSQCQLAVGDYPAAVETFTRLLRIERQAVAIAGGRYLSRALARYGAMLAELGHYDAALSAVQQSEQILNAGQGPDSVEHFHVQFGYARIYQLQQDWPRAIRHWRHYVELRRRELAPEAPQLALGELRLADTLMSAGNVDEAAELVQSALPRLHAIHGEQHPEYGLGLAIRARLRALQGQSETALQDYANALDALPKLERNDLDVAVILDRYTALRIRSGLSGQEVDLQQRAAEIREQITSASTQLDRMTEAPGAPASEGTGASTSQFPPPKSRSA